MSRLTPELTTKRLRLRGYARDDFDWFDDLWREPAVVRHTGGKRRTRTENWPRFLLDFGMWETHGFGFWLIEDRASGERLGIAGVMDAMRALEATRGEVEAGWVLAPAAFGRGIATEAMGEILRWVDARIDAPRTVCIIEPDNAASLRVAAKLGYEVTGSVAFERGVIDTFARPRGG